MQQAARAPRNKVRRPPVLCVAQQKGGVSKTTSALSLSAAWADAGHRVLMIDTDPQANLTRSIVDYETISEDVSQLYRGAAALCDLVMHTPYERLDLVPARPALSRVEGVERTLGTFNVLRRAVPGLAEAYDYLVIDTPPSLGLFTVSALLAATHVLVPVQPTFLCQEGLGDLNVTVQEVRENNAELRSIRYVITLYDRRTVIGQDLAASIRKELGKRVFRSIISRNVAIEESQFAGKTIFDHAPGSRGAADFRSLAAEVATWLASD